MACDIMGAGSRAKGKDRAEERDRTSDVSRQACREAQWGWGEQVGSALGFFFLYFTPTWIIRGRMEGSCGLCVNRFPLGTCPRAVIENVYPHLQSRFNIVQSNML